MILVTAATSMELAPLLAQAPGPAGMATLITGVGPVEAGFQVCRTLAQLATLPDAVLNIGTAGAYQVDQGAGLLDVCLADREVLGDLGVCHHDRVEPLGSPALEIVDRFELDRDLTGRAQDLLVRNRVPVRRGTFVTVSCVSGTARRGAVLAAAHGALCENMEGAAIARVCQGFGVPMVELRCISNMVEDRRRGNWQMEKAAELAARAAAVLLREI